MSGADAAAIARGDGAGGGGGVHVAGAVEAETTRSRLGDARIVVGHTAVPDALRGRGVERTLAKRMVADARAEGLEVVTLRPFVKAQARRHPDRADGIA